MPEPRYRLPASFVAEAVVSLLLGRCRDIVVDAARLLAPVEPRLRALGEAYIPKTGPLVVVANHYERAGMWMIWGMFLLSRTLGQRRPGLPLHWVMTSEWRRFRLLGLLPVPSPLFRWPFRRLAAMYDFVVLPAVEERVLGRAVALRSALAKLQGDATLGLYPEGDTSFELREARPGSGAFLLLASQRGVPLLPVGVYEEDGVLTVAFGQPFSLEVGSGRERAEQDQLAREQAMTAIARLLPAHLWGFYQESAERAIRG